MNRRQPSLRLALASLVMPALFSPAPAPAAQALAAASPPASFQRLGALTLSDGRYSGLYSAVIDPGNGYAYFATANAINPGWVIKVDVNGALPVEVGAAAMQTGEFNLDVGVIDAAAGYAYFGTTGSPGRIVKIALGAGGAPPTYVGSLTLDPGEDSTWGAVIDPANGYAYFATNTTPGRVVKVALGAGNALPTRVGALTLDAGEDHIRRAVIDTANGYAYFATNAVTPKVIKVALGAGGALPTRVGAVTLDAATAYNLGSAVIDTTHGYAYFGTYDSAAGKLPARVFKVALGPAGAAPTLIGALTLNAGERELSTAIIDTAAGYAYFGTDHTYPGKIYQIKLGVGGALPTETGLLTLQAGSQPNPPDGQNKINSPETLYGEVYLQSSVFDPVRGYAYFGTDSNHGQVVKVALPAPAAFTPLAWLLLPLIVR